MARRARRRTPRSSRRSPGPTSCSTRTHRLSQRSRRQPCAHGGSCADAVARDALTTATWRCVFARADAGNQTTARRCAHRSDRSSVGAVLCRRVGDVAGSWPARGPRPPAAHAVRRRQRSELDARACVPVWAWTLRGGERRAPWRPPKAAQAPCRRTTSSCCRRRCTTLLTTTRSLDCWRACCARAPAWRTATTCGVCVRVVVVPSLTPRGAPSSRVRG